MFWTKGRENWPKKMFIIHHSIQFIADYSVAEPELDIKTVIATVIRDLMELFLLK